MAEGYPKQYEKIRERFKDFFEAVNSLGMAVRKSGPLDEKTIQLIQLAAAAAIRSEGAVHSHTRRAIQAGASKEELYQTVLCLTSTIGFPTVSAALSWMEDIIERS